MAWDRNQMAARVAHELQDGKYVNLGIGPFQTEDKIDVDLINAGKQTVTAPPHSAFFDPAQSLAMICGGKIAMTILGAMDDLVSSFFLPSIEHCRSAFDKS